MVLFFSSMPSKVNGSPSRFVRVVAALLIMVCVCSMDSILLAEAACVANVQYVKIQFTGTVQLTLQEVQVWVGTTNAALSGSASLSNVNGVNAASRCIDNDPSRGSATYCQTISESNPWFEINLVTPQCVDRVVVFNFQANDAFVVMNKMAGATVTFFASGHVTLRTFTAAGQNIEIFQDGAMPTTARKVKIKQSRAKVINLREVKVIDSAGTNVAYNKAVTLSSTASSNAGSICVDDVLTVALFCETNAGYEEYLEIDLVSDTVIDRVIIYNRHNTNYDHIDRNSLLLLDSNGQIVNVQETSKSPLVSVYHFGTPAYCGFRYLRIETGKNVRIELNEVFAYLNGLNIAKDKSATQSADYSGAVASRAVDGRSDECFTITDCSSATTADWEAWWEIDFGTDTCIDYILVHGQDSSSSWSNLDRSALLLLDSNRIPVRGGLFNPKSGTASYYKNQFMIKPGADTAQTTTGCQNGQYVRVERTTTDSVGVVEIMVFAGTMNVALGKTVTWNGGSVPERVTDGSVNDVSSAVSTASATAFIQVDLAQAYCVDRILIVGQKWVSAHINNCLVKFQDASFADVQTWSTTSDYYQMFYLGSQATIARHIRFDLGSSNYLHCREVIVMSGGTNVAFGKPTVSRGQVSTAADSVCVDGATTHASNGVVNFGTGLGSNKYWQVDLQANYNIDGIFYYNRMDVPGRINLGTMQMLDEYFNIVRVWPMNSDDIQSFHPATPSTCGIKYVHIAIGQNNYLHLREVEVWSGGVNVALQGTATQDSDHSALYTAPNANNNNWNWRSSTDGFLSHTAISYNAWWRLELTSAVCIDYINIHNRVDASPGRLIGASLLLLDANQNPVQNKILSDDRTQPFYFNASYIPTLPADCVNTRYVRVETTTAHYLLMLEVEVFWGHVNVAILKPTSSSSVSTHGPAGCVDGHHFDESADTMCQTGSAVGQWWQLDLEKEYCISHAVIWSHDAYPSRIDNSIVKFQDGTASNVRTWTTNSDSVQFFQVSSSINSIRYVRIDQTVHSYLQLREVEVWQGSTNIANGKSAQQYTDNSAGVTADHAVNGNYVHDDVAITSATRIAWWEVDLGQAYEINSVVVYNRFLSPTRLVGAIVLLYDQNRVPQYVFKFTDNVAQMFYVKNASSCNLRYARIEASSSTQLYFQELEVWKDGQNIAPQKTVSQSSVAAAGREATVCNNGYRWTIMPYTICHTSNSYNAWWEMDFLANTCLDYIEFFNREDAGWVNLDGAVLFLLDDTRAVIQAQRLTSKYRQIMQVNSSFKVVTSGCVWARYFRAERTTVEALTMQEVEIYTGYQNVALIGTATSSTTVTQGPSWCIDGSTWQASYCHTASSATEWFQIDLGEEFCVTHVVVYGYDPVLARMLGVTFKLQDSGAATLREWTNSQQQSIYIYHVAPVSNLARYVRVEMQQNHNLMMREVKVSSGGVNVALSKTTAQRSDNSVNQVSSKCVDDSTSFIAGDNDCCITAAGWNDWWEVDLGQEYAIDTFTIYNRIDYSPQWLDGSAVVILDENHVPRQTERLSGDNIQTKNFTEKKSCGVRYVRVETATNIWFAMWQVRAFSNGVNIAEGKAASHSGPYPNPSAGDRSYAAATNCNDGRLEHAFTAPSWFCCHSDTQSYNNYWEVDLGVNSCVDYMDVAAFMNAPSYILRASLLILDDNRIPLQTFPLAQTQQQGFFVNASYKPVTDGCINAQYLRIERTTAEYLVLQEIEIFSGPINVALGKTVTLSVQHVGHVGSNCVDGDPRAILYCHTTLSASAWIKVDLGEEFCVSHVVLTSQYNAAHRWPNNLVKLQDAGEADIKTWITGNDQIEVYRVGPKVHNARYVRLKSTYTGILHVSELMVDSYGENIALGKFSHQYTVGFGNSASGGNDGNLETYQETTATEYAWYEVDFNASYPVHSVAVYNSVVSAALKTRIDSDLVVLKDENYVTIQTFRLNSDKLQLFLPNQSDTIPTLPECGIRYVQVMIGPTEVLNMDEVQVISATGQNLAPAGTATQRDTFVGGAGTYAASNCNDGDTNSGDGSTVATQTCQTNSHYLAWWQLDLGAPYCVDRVIIYNRGDLLHTRLDTASVMLNSAGNVPLRVFQADSSQVQVFRLGNEPYELPDIHTIKILRQSGTLHMREVQAMMGTKNMALSATATQSTIKSPPNADGSGPEICMDGSTATVAGNAVCHTQTGYNQWWQVVFPRPWCIGHMEIYNRADANAALMNRASVLVFTEKDSFPEKAFNLDSSSVQQVVTGSKECTSTMSTSPTFSSTSTFSETPTSIASVTATPSHSLFATQSSSLLATNTISFPSTASLTLTRTRTQTITPPPTLTPSSTLTSSYTSSIMPTASLTIGLTKTITLSKSVTLSFSPSRTLPGTPSVTVTESLTSTVSETQSRSLDFYCSGLLPEICALQLGVCNVSESGVCFSANCTGLTSSGTCLMQGCQWLITRVCTKPRECRDYRDPDSCESSINCRWSDVDRICNVDRTPCNTFESQSECQDAYCAWNTITTPQCFRPFRTSGLCMLVEDELTCKAQQCLWINALQRCEPWDLKCEDVLPRPDICPLLDRCLYFEQESRCISLDNIPPGAIAGVQHLPVVFPVQEFDVQFIGVPLDVGTIIGVTSADSITQCPIGIGYRNMTYVFQINEEFDEQTKSSAIRRVLIHIKGNYTFCIKYNNTFSIGPLSRLTVDTPTPELSSCSASPPKPFSGELFSVAIRGYGLDPVARVAFFANRTICPDFNASIYLPVLQYSPDLTITSFVFPTKAFLLMCYANRGGIPVSCPKRIVVQGIPPWYDFKVLNELSQEKAEFESTHAIEWNSNYCIGLQNANRTRGVFAHPKTMEIIWGDGVNPYPRSTVCAAVLSPLAISDVAPNAKALHLFIRYLSLETSDEVRLFVPSDNSVLQECAFTDKEQCKKSYCYWNDAAAMCSIPQSNYIDGCPRNIKGYTMERVLTYEVHQKSSVYQESIKLPLQGAIALFCSSDSSKSGVGVHMVYQTQETYCKNDCKDERGTSNGICRQSMISGGFMCRCNTGFTGDDCSRPSKCRGVRNMATTVKAARGEEQAIVTKEACGTIFEMDPSLGSFPKNNMNKYGVGAKIKSLSLFGGNCSTDYVLIREASYSGKLIVRLCPEDNVVLGTEVFRFLLENSTSFYVEHHTSSSIDGTYVLEYTAVSLVCPGTSGPTGIPETDDEICDGRGECTAVGYEESSSLSTSRYVCVCRLPWGASTSGGTCNTCGFGYMKTTFPECKDATICARNCSGNGICLPEGRGCLCNEGFYGLDCTLIDDGERLGTLKPDLLQRVPLNGGDAGNVIQSGSVDRTLMDCSLAASTIPCRQDKRPLGRKFAKKENSIWDSQDIEDELSYFFRRRRQTNISSNSSNETEAEIDEQGMSLNLLATEDTYPQFIRTDNISADKTAFGAFSILGWVKVTSLTKGFLFAKTDSAFYSDGQSPVLERAVIDIEERNIPLHKLRLFKEKLNVHIAIFMNGPRKRIDILVTRADARRGQNVTNKEDWLYVRHFRLGKKAGSLYDGTWHFVVLELYQTDTRYEGLVFVDGFTSIVDPNFVQCVPFLPPFLPPEEISTDDTRVVKSFPGTSVWWGYRLQGSVDELHVYSKPLPQKTVIDIGGDDFRDVLMLPASTLMSLMFLGVVILVIVILLFVFWWQDQRDPPEEEETDEGEEINAEDKTQQKEPLVEVPDKNEGSMQEPNPLITSQRQDENAVVEFQTALGPTDPAGTSLHISAIQIDSMADTQTAIAVPEGESDVEETVTDESLEQDRNECGPLGSVEQNLQGSQQTLQENLKHLKYLMKEDLHLETEDSVQLLRRQTELLERQSGEITTAKVNLMNYLKNGNVNDEHLNLLLDIQELMESEVKKEQTKEKAKSGNGLSAFLLSLSTSFTNSGEKENIPYIVTGTLDCFQIIAAMSISMGFPIAWKSIWGDWAFFWSLEFLEAFNIPFAAMFYVMLATALICMLILFITHLCTKQLKHDELVSELENIHDAMKVAIKDEEKYSFPGKWKATLIMGISSVLTILYMPLTRQALKAIVCHRSIMCMYDCYNDAEHKLLVVLGIIVLVVVTLGTPLFYVFTIRSTMIQYHYFIGSFDEELQAKYWKPYTSVMHSISPFSSLYDRFRHQYAYFEVFVMVFKVLMIGFLMVMVPESVAQTASVMVLQGLFLLFIAGGKPGATPLSNKVMATVHTYLVIMLIFQISFMIHPENKHFARVMVAVTFFLIFLIVYWVIKAMFMSPKQIRVREQEEGKKQQKKVKRKKKKVTDEPKILEESLSERVERNEVFVCDIEENGNESEEKEEKKKRAAEDEERQKKAVIEEEIRRRKEEEHRNKKQEEEDMERKRKLAATEEEQRIEEEEERQKKAEAEQQIKSIAEEEEPQRKRKIGAEEGRKNLLLQSPNVRKALEMKASIEIEKEKLEKEITQLHQRLDSNSKALKGLKPRDLNEIKQFKKPPRRVQLVVEAALLILGEKEVTWDKAKNFMIKKDIGKELLQVQKVSLITLVKLREHYLTNPDFQPEAVREANVAVYPLCLYIFALCDFSARESALLKPLQERIAQQEESCKQHVESLTSDEKVIFDELLSQRSFGLDDEMELKMANSAEEDPLDVDAFSSE